MTERKFTVDEFFDIREDLTKTVYRMATGPGSKLSMDAARRVAEKLMKERIVDIDALAASLDPGAGPEPPHDPWKEVPLAG